MVKIHRAAQLQRLTNKMTTDWPNKNEHDRNANNVGDAIDGEAIDVKIDASDDDDDVNNGINNCDAICNCNAEENTRRWKKNDNTANTGKCADVVN